MKKTLFLSLMCLASMGSFAQIQYTLKEMPKLDDNGQPVMVTPTFNAPCKMVADDPCAMYKKNGEVVLNCPTLRYEPQEICEQKEGQFTGSTLQCPLMECLLCQ
jgi:hypothetical protein